MARQTGRSLEKEKALSDATLQSVQRQFNVASAQLEEIMRTPAGN
jgi:hypothetical protein